MHVDYILIGAVVLILGATVWFATAAPARNVANDAPVPTTTAVHAIAHSGQATGTLGVHLAQDVPAGTDLLFDVLDDVVSEPLEQPAKRSAAGITVSYQRNRDIIDPSDSLFTDWGTWAGGVVRGGGGGLHGGFRCSPVRLYGAVAPEVLIGEHELGAGVSFYPPPDVLGRVFRHWGLGIGHLWSTADGSSGTDIYLSFSTR